MNLFPAEKLVYQAFYDGLIPPPLMGVSDWADGRRKLVGVSSAEPGQWRTSRVPFMREPMDCLSMFSPYEEVVIQKARQVAGTECGLNFMGASMELSPSPSMYVLPTVNLAKSFSKQRVAPMIEATPEIRRLFRAARERDSGNTILTKEFEGGILFIKGANSAAELRSSPFCYGVFDEVDAYPGDVGGEGDPIQILKAAAATFPRRKFLLISTPTEKGLSRIEREFLLGDQRFYFVPCPHCKHFQKLDFEHIKFEKDREYRLTSEVVYICDKCGAAIEEHYKTWMLERGEWRATAKPEADNIASFHISTLYSPAGWKYTWEEIAKEFLKAKRERDTNLLKTWVNTLLGETWEDRINVVDDGTLYGRRENYGPQIPDGVAFLTCAVDTQDDRLEAEVVGWGKDEESWSLEWVQLFGDPGTLELWDRLDAFLVKRRDHISGAVMMISCTTIDSGGHYTNEVYNFCKPREFRHIYPVKGSSESNGPLVYRPSTSNVAKVKLFRVGTDTAKDTIFSRLKLETFGPGYMHHPANYDEEYFKQLTGEKKVTKHYQGSSWSEYVKKRARVEALDLKVYNLAAQAILETTPEWIEQVLNGLRGKHFNFTGQGGGGRRIISEGVDIYAE